MGYVDETFGLESIRKNKCKQIGHVFRGLSGRTMLCSRTIEPRFMYGQKSSWELSGHAEVYPVKKCPKEGNRQEFALEHIMRHRVLARQRCTLF